MAPKNKKKDQPITNYEIGLSAGKIPPQAVDLEETILGSCLLEKEALIQTIKILRVDSFYRESHQHIFTGMLALHDRGDPADILTVTKELQSLGTLELVGGPYYITQLTSRVGSGANIEYWCRKVEEFAIRRRLLRINFQTIKDCYDLTEDTFKIVDTHQKALDSGTIYVSGNAPEAKIRTKNTMAIVDKAIDSDEEIFGATCGIKVVDNVTGGWMGGDLIIVAGRPGMGKTAMVLNTCYRSNRKVALFELEMSEYQVTSRELAMFSGIPMEQIKTGTIDKNEYDALLNAENYINSRNVLIDTSPSLDVTKLRAKLYDYINKFGVEMAVIDYLQLMNMDEEDKYSNYALAVGKVTRALKLMAKQFDIPIIILSQLNRAVEGRAVKKPQLSDLRDSGAIEQDADCVIFLYREEYYNKDATIRDADGTESSVKNMIEFIIAKNRQGRLGEVTTGYEPATNNFGDEFKTPITNRNYRPL